MKLKKKYGTVFWITGLSGVGKTTISKNILKKINKHYGPTIFFNGDDLRKIFNLNKYDKESRKEYAIYYSKLCKFIVNQKINVLIAVVGLFHDVRKWNRKNIKNYIEIFVTANKSNIKKKDNRLIYKKKNVFGKDIKAELPKKSHIKIHNNFKTKPSQISSNLFSQIKKII